MPKPFVPMAMPVRLTDNAMCKANSSISDETKQEDPYCYIDFDTIGDYDITNVGELFDLTGLLDDGSSDFCATSVDWLNPGGTTLDLCVTEDNRLLNGRVASTRVRMNFKPYTQGGWNEKRLDCDGG